MKNKKILLVLVSMMVLVPFVAFGSSLFYVDDSGNVGIGNTTPAHKLDVSGSVYSRLVTVTDSSSTTINWNSGNVQSLALSTATTSLSFSNAQAGGEYKLIVKQDATGGRALVWPSSNIEWPGGTEPALTTTASASDVISFVYDGSNYLGSATLQYKAPPQLLFSDNFNRTNSNTVGNSWNEGVYTFWTNEEGYESNVISGNALKQGSTDPTYDGGTVSRTYSGQTTNIKIDGRFTWVSGNAFVFLKSTANTWASGWGMVLDGTNVKVRDGGADKASSAFSLTGGVSYDYEIDVDSNNHMFIYLWATSGSKPGSPTVSWTNSGSPYTVSETGNQLSLTFQTSSGTYGYWDFIDIYSQ